MTSDTLSIHYSLFIFHQTLFTQQMDNKGYLDMELLRFTTAGSVDDGKSTLIGRLLYDSKSIFEDQLDAVRVASQHRGNEEMNLALLTDGLRAEREQGITIDVAYRYFATPKRKFIIADTPGHVQYTRNMVTGASTADLAIILIDARNGVVEQTIRHSCIASLLGTPYITVCINKMDMVGFDEGVYHSIRSHYLEMAERMGITANINFIPISAKYGDNVVDKSTQTKWYDGPALLGWLESVPIGDGKDDAPMRFPVQYVIRPISDKFPDYRAYAGRVASGTVRKGDRVKVYPSGLSASVKDIRQVDTSLDEAFASQSVSLLIDEDIDISRGDTIVSEAGLQPAVARDIDAMCCWFNEVPLTLGRHYIIKNTTAESIGVIKSIAYKLDINNMSKNNDVSEVRMNDIAYIHIRTANPMVVDSYSCNHTTGSFIIIDPSSFETVGAAMVTDNETNVICDL